MSAPHRNKPRLHNGMPPKRRALVVLSTALFCSAAGLFLYAWAQRHFEDLKSNPIPLTLPDKKGPLVVTEGQNLDRPTVPAEFGALTAVAHFMNQGRWAQAEVALSHLEKQGLGRDIRQTLALLRYSLGRKEDAIETLKSSLRRDSLSPKQKEERLWLLVDLLSRMERYADARAQLDTLALMIPRNEDAERTLTERAEALKRAEDWQNSRLTWEGQRTILFYPSQGPLAQEALAQWVGTLADEALNAFESSLGGAALPAGTRITGHIHAQEDGDSGLEGAPHPSDLPDFPVQAFFNGHMHFFVPLGLALTTVEAPLSGRNPRQKAPSSPENNSALLRLKKQVKHETTHAALDALCGPIVPAWLGEGLAQRAEGKALSQSEWVVHRYLGPQRAQARTIPWVTQPTELPHGGAAVFYAAAHVLVDNLISQRGQHALEATLQGACLGGLGFQEALQNTYGSAEAQTLWDELMAQRAP